MTSTSTTMRAGRGQRGFTLVEVLIALAILFGALVMMLSRVTADVQATNEAKLLTAATGLARAKMLDIEEELVQKGFQELGEELEGDFSDDGFPRYRWSAKIEKVELPPMSQMQAAQGQADGDQPGAGLTGIAGQGGGAATQAAGASMISSQFDMIAKVLEQALRKVTLTVEWQVGKRTQTLVVVCYFTEPKAVDASFLGAAGSAGGSGGGGSGGGGSGGGGGPAR